MMSRCARIALQSQRFARFLRIPPVQFSDETVAQVPLHAVRSGSKPHWVTLEEVLCGSQGYSVVIGSVGPFVPPHSDAQLVGFADALPRLARAGVKNVSFISVQDAYVLDTWANACGVHIQTVGEAMDAPERAHLYMLADPLANFTRSISMERQYPELGLRSERYAVLIRNERLVAFVVEKDPDSYDASTPEAIVALLEREVEKKQKRDLDDHNQLEHFLGQKAPSKSQ